ncbi:MAG: hypothetical protein U9R64_12415 [Pseudomonadota bacterium]|nr:hypothetical protein [Pseudomonadota bacterium]
MTQVDIAALEKVAEGEGEVRVTKRWLRGIVAQMKTLQAADRTRDIFDRMYGTNPR